MSQSWQILLKIVVGTNFGTSIKKITVPTIDKERGGLNVTSSKYLKITFSQQDSWVVVVGGDYQTPSIIQNII